MPDIIAPIEKPADLPKTPTPESAIFAMPEAYRHGKRPMAAPAKPASAIAPAPLPPPMPAPMPIKKPGAVMPRQGGRGKWVAIVIVLLVIAAGAAFYFLRAKPAPVVPSVPTPAAPIPRAPEPTAPVPSSPQPARPGTDSDSDGLTDHEETLIYRTDPRLPDTDNDGFLDGNEVFHRYDPSAVLSGTLLESGLVKQFEDATFSVLYPAGWQVSRTSSMATFTATTGESIVLSLLPGSLDVWTASQSSTSFTRTTTKNGYAEEVSNNQLLAALDATGKSSTPTVIKAVYDASGKATVDYLQTFKMMINSVLVK